MSTIQKPGTQQGSQSAPAPQQGQTNKPSQQQGSTPVFRDWAAI